MTPIVPSALSAVRGGAEVVPESPAMCRFYMGEAKSFLASADWLASQYTDDKIPMDIASLRDLAMSYARLSDKCWSAQSKR